MSSFTSTFVGSTIRGGEPTRLLGKLEESRCNSLLREKEEEIIRLKEEMRRMMTGRYESETKTVYKEVVKEADHTHCNLRIR